MGITTHEIRRKAKRIKTEKDQDPDLIHFLQMTATDTSTNTDDHILGAFLKIQKKTDAKGKRKTKSTKLREEVDLDLKVVKILTDPNEPTKRKRKEVELNLPFHNLDKVTPL